MLVRTAGELVKRFPQLRLLFVGADTKGFEDSYFRQLRDEVRDLGLESRVIFTGFRTDIPECLSVMDVFVLPSQTENFGTVLLEAMAMERACLGTESGGTPEILDKGNAGLLFQYGNLEDLLEKLRRLLENDDLRRDLGRRASQRIQQHFRLDSVIDRWIRAYQRLFDQR